MARAASTSSAWRLDGDTIAVRIPMRLSRRGGRKVIIAPDGAEAWAPPVPEPDSTLIRALARAHRWQRLLEAGVYATVTDLAKAEKVNDSYVHRILRLNLLAPAIVETIVDGRQPRELHLRDLLRDLPVTWSEQVKTIGFAKRRDE